jgi:hypothetical protein
MLPNCSVPLSSHPQSHFHQEAKDSESSSSGIRLQPIPVHHELKETLLLFFFCCCANTKNNGTRIALLHFLSNFPLPQWNRHRQQEQQPEHGFNSFSSSVPFLLSSRFNLLFTNSSFLSRKKNFKTKSCKNIAANLPDLKKTRQSFAAPKISPSRIDRPQNLKKHLVNKEGRGGGDKNKKASSKDSSLLRACKYNQKPVSS